MKYPVNRANSEEINEFFLTITQKLNDKLDIKLNESADDTFFYLMVACPRKYLALSSWKNILKRIADDFSIGSFICTSETTGMVQASDKFTILTFKFCNKLFIAENVGDDLPF